MKQEKILFQSFLWEKIQDIFLETKCYVATRCLHIYMNEQDKRTETVRKIMFIKKNK